MRKIIFAVLVVLWMSLIFFFSNQKADDSTKLSDGFIANTIGNIYKIFDKNISEEKLTIIKEKYTPYVRKLAHFTLYFILGIFVLFFLKEYNLKIKHLLLLSVLICFIYASSDEIHQLFIEGRSCDVKDIIIDTLGSFFGSSFILFICKNKKMQ